MPPTADGAAPTVARRRPAGAELDAAQARVTASGLIFLAAAFPFVIPLIPSTDTQPTFTLAVFLLAALACVASFDRPFRLRRSDFLLAGGIVLGGLLWFTASVAANGFEVGNLNRAVSYAMLLVAVATGLLNDRIFTPGRLTMAFKLYLLFTALFFISDGAIEGLLIRSRGAEALSGLTESGRGASTLSPEPSFFAFQVFTLFLAARLTVWNELDRRRQHVVQWMTIALLLSSLGGYGILYAAVVVFLSGWRYMLAGAVVAIGGAAVLVSSYDLASLRFVRLFTTLLRDAVTGDSLTVTDISTLGRLNSFLDYIRTFLEKPIFGDAFDLFGGGGLVSVPASVGLFGLALLLLFLVATFTARIGFKLKVALLVWFVFQFVSGPVGLPLVGLLIGTVIAASRIADLPGAIRAAGADYHPHAVRDRK